MEKKLYTWVTFNQKGNLRGFSSGFSKSEATKLIMKDLESNLILKIDSLSIIPDHMLNSFYIKTSNNNDLEIITGILENMRSPLLKNISV